MIGAVILAAFVAGISALTCLPPITIPPEPETFDDFYRLLLTNLNDAEVAAARISATAQSAGGCTKFENIDVFTQLLVTINADNTWLDKVGGGYIPGGDECVGVNLRIDFDLNNIQGKAATLIESPVCTPTGGPVLSQYVLQQFGRALAALSAAPASPGPVGCWQKYVQDLNAGIKAVEQVIANNDTANCAAAVKTLANALVGIRASGSGTACPPSVTTSMGSTGYAASG